VKALLAAELIKVRTTRTFFALAGVAIATSLLLAGLVASLTEPTEDSVLTDVFASDTSSIFILILAIVGITGEWRHRTITSSLLAAPDRVRFLIAKTVAFAVAGAALSIAIAVAIAVLGLTILSARGLPTPGAGDLLELAARNAAVAALLGAFGVGVGALVRNQPVAIVGVFVLALIVEPLLIGLVPSVGRFGPIIALPNGIVGVGEEEDFFSALPAVALMLAWIGVLFAAGAALLRRRDLNS
jgi:ABC-2 type transport system permease protein